MSGIATAIAGVGGIDDPSFQNVCYRTAWVIGRHTDYTIASFVPVAEKGMVAYATKVPNELVGAIKKMVSLPSLAGLTKKWREILQELSADLEDTIVTIEVNGEVQAALKGKILE